ncbi:Monovalent cation:proton antiporter 2 [Abortiporus biennis]
MVMIPQVNPESFSGQIIRVANAVLTKRAQAPEQAGVFAGDDPSNYNTNDPFRLWVIQVVIIIAMTQFLSLFLSRIRQPRVIAEVIGGVLLGPSVMGHIPNFSNKIFPQQSLTMLNLTSTIGLVFFLFLVGLEIDVRIVKRNFRASMIISVAGLIIPLGLGAALAVPIYHTFTDPSVNFGYFTLFVAVAVGITAFPVLCRILTELRLLDDTVGVVTLAAGVGNDVVGWILLALTVALVNAGSGLTALWVLLTAIGYVIFLLFPVKWLFRWVAGRTGSLENGTPTTSMMTLTLILVLGSAFFTDIIGIHAIFGGFLAGLIIPKDNGFDIALVEKLEDFVTILLLPIYFALSGLKTNLGLLNNGITWGYTILICVVAFFSKFLGCAVTAKLTGFNLRQSGAIGALMSCKGLVELIVLNVGFSAGILDTRTFSMFVLHALVLTFMTTPLTLLIYPSKYRSYAGAPAEPQPSIKESTSSGDTKKGLFEDSFKTRFSVVVDKIEQLPAIMTLTQLLQNTALKSTITQVPPSRVSTNDEKASAVAAPELPYSPTRVSSSPEQGQISVDALRLIELTDRTSAVLKSHSASADSLIHSDPILSVIRTFGYLNRMIVSTALSVIGYDEFSATVAKHVHRVGSQMVVLPWGSGSKFGEEVTLDSEGSSSPVASSNPFDGLFIKNGGTQAREQTAAVVHTQFIRKIFANTPADVALFIDRGLPPTTDTQYGQHIFLPFFGGPDDRLALSFVVQLCLNPAITATVVKYTKVDDELSPMNTIEEEKAQHLHNTIASVHNIAFPDTIYGQGDTQTRLASDTADNILWDKYSQHSVPDLEPALSRIQFSIKLTPRPIHLVLETASSIISEQIQLQSRVIVALGRSRRLATESLTAELKVLFNEKNITVGTELPKTVGDLGAALVTTSSTTSLLVLQACTISS